jgi:hypothetical protein
VWRAHPFATAQRIAQAAGAHKRIVSARDQQLALFGPPTQAQQRFQTVPCRAKGARRFLAIKTIKRNEQNNFSQLFIKFEPFHL